METYQIILIVFASVVAAYLLIILTAFMFFLSFKSMLRKHILALNVVLQTKYDNINKLVQIMYQYDANLLQKYQNELLKIDIIHLAKPHTKEGEMVRNALTMLKDELLLLTDSNEVFQKHEEISLAKQHILELDKVYYFQIMTYNADVIGYNYWIHFLPSRWVFNLFKIKPKEVIS